MGRAASKSGKSAEGKDLEKKAMVFGLLETLQEGKTFVSSRGKNNHWNNPSSKVPISKYDGAMKHLNVVDFSMGIAGPTATQMFADQEANVIKAEFYDAEDPTRSLGPNGGSDYRCVCV